MSRLPEIIRQHEAEINANWLKQMTSAVRRSDLLSERQLQSECKEVLLALNEGVSSGDLVHLENNSWEHAKELLQSISASRAQSGFSPSETATYILSLKRPIFEAVRQELGNKPDELFNEIWTANAADRQAGPAYFRSLSSHTRATDRPPAAGHAGAFYSSGEVVGRNPCAADYRHPGQRAHAGGDGITAGRGGARQIRG